METNTRPNELSENRLLFFMLSNINDHIMPLLIKASMAYMGDPIAFDQLSYLSREFAKVSNLISTIYHYRLFNGDRSKMESLINGNKELEILKEDWFPIWNILSRNTEIEISDLLITAINKLTQLREETYSKCNCFQ